MNRYLENEDVIEEDIEYIKQNFTNKNEVLKESWQLENKLLAEAIDNYYSTTK